MPTIRQARVAEMIKRELAEILQKEMRDPRLSLVSVTDVDVARDFTVAKVFISVIGEPQEKAEALKALQGASGFLRGHLGRALDMRTIPALMFRYDTGIERGARMFELLRTEEQTLAENAALNAEVQADSVSDDMTDATDRTDSTNSANGKEG
jgi:ribosome-binding factor A